jgi:uncharacterized protein
MRIIIDIGHPGHVHYFKYLYLNLKAHDHQILITARNKEVTFELLRYYQMPFASRGKGKKSFFGKIIYLLTASIFIFRSGYNFRPDIIISFSSPYATIAAMLLRCPSIVLDDTEVGRFERYVYKPIVDMIITPKVFLKDLGSKQFRFDGFMELAYLNQKYFKTDPQILNELGVSNNEKFVIIRFVSWEASHDKGQKGLSLQQKNKIIKLCQNYARVFISSEKELPESLEKFRLKISPHKLHNAVFYSSLYIGEGATTASEACFLGTPAIYINTISAGTIEEEEKYGILFNFRNFEGVLGQVTKVLNEKNKDKYNILSRELKKGKIDLTSFLTWLIEEYPQSKKKLFKDPDYQYKFILKTM